MSTTTISSKLVSTFKFALFFMITIPLSDVARAEYYVVYGVPTSVVECYSCGTARIVSAPYRAHKVHYKKKRVKHKTYHSVSRAPARYIHSCYDVAVYHAWMLGPAYCDRAVMNPCPAYRVSSCTRTYMSTPSRYERVEYTPSLDRATADDDPALYPDMNIDN